MPDLLYLVSKITEICVQTGRDNAEIWRLITTIFIVIAIGNETRPRSGLSLLTQLCNGENWRTEWAERTVYALYNDYSKRRAHLPEQSEGKALRKHDCTKATLNLLQAAYQQAAGTERRPKKEHKQFSLELSLKAHFMVASLQCSRSLSLAVYLPLAHFPCTVLCLWLSVVQSIQINVIKSSLSGKNA